MYEILKGAILPESTGDTLVAVHFDHRRRHPGGHSSPDLAIAATSDGGGFGGLVALVDRAEMPC